MTKIITILIIFTLNQIISASIGNQNHQFLECFNLCSKKNCKNLRLKSKESEDEFSQNQLLHMRLLGWSCLDECKYDCMWYTVDYFIKYENFIPQFYGKWPFVRIFGIQEPLSTIASIGNLLAHVYMLNKMRKVISSNAPFKSLWYTFGLISVNAWLWSTIFHTRDFNFTEKMDYFSGFSLVIFQFNAFFIRLFKLKRNLLLQLSMYLISIMCGYFFYKHIHYLGFIEFDYGYNMKVNIIFGGLNSVCWLIWSFYQYFYLKKSYVWRCILSIILLDVFMLLEVLEFSPIFWTIDSHSLWHLSTICIPFYWYQFIIDDNYRIDLESSKIKI